MNPRLLNSLTLAYIGDAVFEIYVREYLIETGIVKVDELQKESVKYVNKFAQSQFIVYAYENSLLLDEEMDIYRRARNTKQRRNKDMIVHKQSTGFEAIIGTYYLEKNKARLDELFEYYKTYIAEGNR